MIDLFNDTSEKNFLNIFYNFYLKENAILKNYKVDRFDNKNIKYSFNNIEQDKDSISETFILSAGSNFFKNEINCNLNGKYSSAFVNGIFSLNDNKHHEIKTIINHLTENTKSYQLIKSVLEDSAKAAYQGKIFVNSDAQKTDGYQLSKAILLNKESEFNAKPELEIYADDVKCSHGSASGSLNEDSIFYLMSRGLNYQQSRELLINGFLLDVVEKINNTIDESEIGVLEVRSNDLKAKFFEDVRKRVNEVTKEGYIDPSSNTIDYALMFVPVEGVFQFIVENEHQLKTTTVDIYEEAISKKIILVPPSLLLVYLSTIKGAVDTFNLQDKAKNLIELHQKFMVQWEKYGNSVTKIGKSIESLQSNYKDLADTRTNELSKVVEKMDSLKLESDN